MRRQDLIPVGLLGIIAAFIGVQAVSMRDSRPRAAEPPTAEQPAPAGRPGSTRAAKAIPADSTAPVDSTIADTVASSDSTEDNDDVDVVEVASTDEPPLRDLAMVQMLIRDGSPGTYLLNMLAEQGDLVVRWPDRRADAIRVWIERNPDMPDWNSEYAVVVERAIEEWQRVGFPLRFLILRDSANTEIKIRWVAGFPEEIGPKVGMTRKLRDQHGWIHAAELTIATRDPRGRRLPPEAIAGTVRHEIGHALGLGHSPAATDVMYPESRTTAISDADRATLRLLYFLPPGLVK